MIHAYLRTLRIMVRRLGKYRRASVIKTAALTVLITYIAGTAITAEITSYLLPIRYNQNPNPKSFHIPTTLIVTKL